MPPASGLQGVGTPPGSPAGFLGLSGQSKCPPFLSCSSSPWGPLPPASRDLLSLPPMPPGPTQPRGDLWGCRTQPESWADFPRRLSRGNAAPTPPQSEPLRVTPDMGTSLRSQPPLRSTSPVRPQLLLPAQSTYILLVCLGVLPVSLGIRVLHQHPAGALVVGRCELCIFPRCHLDSTPPLISFIHSSLYLLILYPYLTPPPFLLPRVTTGLFSVYVSLFLFCYIPLFVLFFRVHG